MQVRFENVFKRYGDFTAVKDLNLTIEDGALHFILGPSGCGKTTTLRMLAGLESVSEGKIWFDDKDVTNDPAASRGIGMVFQNYALWPHMTVRQNIEYGLKIRKLTKEEISSRVNEVLDFTQLTVFVDRYPGQLSGGQQQRVALARSLAIRPNVLLLDEPLSNLDAKLRVEMRDNISKIHKHTGITTIYVTHDQKEALSMGTHISVMHAGIEVQTGSPKTLYKHPNSPFLAGFIGETNIINGTYEGEENGVHQVQTPLGLIESTNMDQDKEKGEEVSLSIRPEAIRIDFSKLAETDNSNNFSLELDRLTFLGDVEQFNLRLDENLALKANSFNTPEHDFKIEDKINISILPEDVLILSPDKDLGPGT